MPVYNAGDFLVEAIESILKQTYKRFELIIVDDGSKDNSWQIIKKYQKKYPQLITKILRLRKNTNAAGNGAVNKVLPYASGEFIARMDADDIAHPQRLEKQVKHLLKNPKIILLGTQARVINKQGQIIGNKSYPLTHEKIYNKYAEVHPIIHPSCMIRRSLLPNKNKLYEMRFGINDDYYTFFKLIHIGQFANLKDYLLDYRIHNNNISLKNLKRRYRVISTIRNQAVKQFSYKLTYKAKVTILIQNMVVRIIPEKILTEFYFKIRGMKQFIMIPSQSVKLVFAKVKNYTLSLI